MKIKDFYAKVKSFEHELAHGSETHLWGDVRYITKKETGKNIEQLADENPDYNLDDEHAQWWLKAYRLYEKDIQLESEGKEPVYPNIQSLYDSV